MAEFNDFVHNRLQLSLVFFAAGLGFGLLYALNLLGVTLPGSLLTPQGARSIHITLMLYGFIPLMLSFLPFLLIAKEAGVNQRGLYYLRLFTLLWYIFLITAVLTLAFGLDRGLPFYDFIYGLNFLLAFAGVFYIIALIKFLQEYERYPLWVKVSLFLTVIAPLLLLFLMNPEYGQVEKTLSGPHGDNTLGMSLALIPLYYLIIKYKSGEPFIARWNWMWALPLGFYLLSVLHRSFVGELTYNQEWFLQYLTLLYLPLLYRWYSDAKLERDARWLLLVSLAAFFFVDIEGNLLFIPQIRWLIHRNDLVIAHAHIAMGIGVLFMVAALYSGYLYGYMRRIKGYLLSMAGLAAALSLSGVLQGFGYVQWIFWLWLLRFLFGAAAFGFVLNPPLRLPSGALGRYNLLGAISDGLGGVVLLFFGESLYRLAGFDFVPGYIYAVFAFVITTGVIHLLSLLYPVHAVLLTRLSAGVRVLLASVFLSLFLKETLGLEALLIAAADFGFVLLYLFWIYGKNEGEAYA